jgi:hypothetical protein
VIRRPRLVGYPEPKAEPAQPATDHAEQLDAAIARKKAKPEGAERPALEEIVAKGVEEPEEAEPAASTAIVVAPLQGELILPWRAAGAEMVEALNQKHSVIGNYGSKCVVLSWERWSHRSECVGPIVPNFRRLQETLHEPLRHARNG